MQQEILSNFWTHASTCGQIVTDQKVTFIEADTPIEAACEVLAEHKILSAPVYNSSTKTFVGFFDYSDLMAYLLSVLQHPDNNKQNHSVSEEGATVDKFSSFELRELIRTAMLKQNISANLASGILFNSLMYKTFRRRIRSYQ